MSRFLIFYLVFVCPMVTIGQVVPEWGFAGVSNEVNRYSTVDNDGSVYVAGWFEDTMNLQPSTSDYILTSMGFWDSYVMKLTPTGEIEWVLHSSCTEADWPRSISVDTDGNIMVMGIFYESMSFENHPSISAQDQGTYFLKISSSGNLLWAKSVDANMTCMTLDTARNIYAEGWYHETADLDPGQGEHVVVPSGSDYYESFIFKLDPYGDLIWAQDFEGDSTDFTITSMKVNAQNDLCVVGHFRDVVDFDPEPSQHLISSVSNHWDIFMLKLNSLGQFQWVKNIGNVNDDRAQDVVIDHQGNWLVTGYFFEYLYTQIDFDPGPATHLVTCEGGYDSFILKLDALGNFVWVRTYGSVDHDRATGIVVDSIGNSYGTGAFSGTVDFDNGPGTFTLTETNTAQNTSDGYIVKLDTDGNFIWAESIVADDAQSIFLDDQLSVYVTGQYGYDYESLVLNPSNFELTFLALSEGFNYYTAKFRQSGVLGRLFFDGNENCSQDSIEPGLSNRLAVIEPGGIVVQTNHQGVWHADALDVGNYTIAFDTLSGWIPTCTAATQFSVSSATGATALLPIGFVNTSPCPKPTVSVFAPFLRRCFSDQKIHVEACNSVLASEALIDSYVDLQISEHMTPESSSIPYINLGNNLLRIETGDLQPGQCTSFWIGTQISCDAVLNQSLCLEANIFPLDSCMLDTIPALLPADFTPCSLPWDGSSLEVTGWCDDDSIRFAISNIGDLGEGDMQCYSPLRLFIDGHYILLDSVMLEGGATDSLAFLADGRTWRLEVDQHVLHPGNSNPSTTVELCNNSGNWTPHLVATLPQDELNPLVDIYCGTVSGSYDPNDKTGYPLGVSEAHLIEPNGQLDYVIRFQNTGTDTAFTVVIRDTLDTNLDVFSLVSGASSHSYDFRIYGPRVAEWTFNNILLPDSTTDLLGSQGFVCFKANQSPNLSPGTEITNTADIYFDFNEPVITNTTSHVVADEPGRTELDSVTIEGCSQVVFEGETYTNDGTYFQLLDGETDTMLIIDASIFNINATISENNGVLLAQSTNTLPTFQWLNCDNSYELIIGETDSVFYPSASGNYAIEVTVDECTDTSSCFNVTLAGLSETIGNPLKSRVSVYPNPTLGGITIEVNAGNNLAVLNVYDVFGKLVKTAKLESVQLNYVQLPEPSGFYNIQVISIDGIRTNLKVLKL